MKVKIPDAFKFLFRNGSDGSIRYRCAYGGRGSAKSHSFATALVLKGAQRPLRVLCCREIQRSIKDSVKRLIDDKIDACGLRWFYQSTETEIRGANGTLFVFAGLRTNPDNIKSLEGLNIAWVEEASSASRSSLEILIPTVRGDKSEIWFTWNPNSPNDPVDQMFRGKDGPPPKSIVREVNWNDNPFFPGVLREEMEWARKRDPDKYAHVWAGGYIRNSEARVFKNWGLEEFETPEDARFYFGADWGFATDPTVLVRCYIDGGTLYVDQEAYRVGCSIDNTPALFDTVDGARKWPITADSARPETIDYMQRHGFPRIAKSVKGAGSVEDGVEFLKNYDIVVHPRCKHTSDELTFYSYKVDKQTGDVLPVLEDKKNHVIDALRYALEGVRRSPATDNISIGNLTKQSVWVGH